MKTRTILLIAAAVAWLAWSEAVAQPTLTIQPEDQSICLNDAVQFRVGARSSGGTLRYRWWLNEAALDPALNPTATRATLTLSNVTEALIGGYSAVISDDNGSVTSRVARLTIDPAFARVLEPGFTNQTVYSIGAAWGDYDNDGDIDLFVGNGAFDGAQRNFLYRNSGHGTFQLKTAAEVGPIAGDADDFSCGAWGDFDNDGDLDLVVSRGAAGAKTLKVYLNLGNGTFSSVAAGDLGTVRSVGGLVNWGDYDNDGFIDLFQPVAWDALGQHDNRLYHNRGDGAFGRVLEGPVATDRIPVGGGGLSNGGAWGDFDNDGDLDLVVANLGVAQNFLYQNDGRGTFLRLKDSIVEQTGGAVHANWGDYDNDGDLDLAMGYGTSTRLFRNEGPAGWALDTVWPVPSAFGYPTWVDYDNDGHLDSCVISGQESRQPIVVFHGNGDGTFTQASGGLATAADYWLFGAWGDYDNDGFMDLFLTERHGRNALYQNRKNANHWLRIRLVGTASNRAAIGAKVRVKATIAGKTVWQLREVSGGSAGQDDLRPNFGLGDATVAEVLQIEWPSGNVQEYFNQSVDQLRTITEPTRIQPPRPTASLGGAVTLTNAYRAGTYQWRFNGVDLAGETKRTLTLANLQAGQQGRYSVVVTAANGTTTTNFAYLFVDTQFTKITDSPVVNDPVDPAAKVSSVGGAWADYDNDGFIDLVLSNDPSSPTWPNFSAPPGRNYLYRNLGNGTFSPVTDSVVTTDRGHSGGCAWADTDNDGLLDLYIHEATGFYRSGPSHPYYFRNLGGGSFERITDDPIAQGMKFSGLPVFGDYDNDGHVDLFLCTAWNSSGTTNSLFHNEGGGRFTQIREGPVATSKGDAQWAVWSDYDNDGRLDLLVSYLRSPARLYHNDGGGRFTRIARSTIFQETESAGAAWGDYDSDGDLDLCLVSYFGNLNVFRNDGSGEFTRTILRPAGNYQVPNWVDYDNDGHLDLFVPEGTAQTHLNHLFRNLGNGTFIQVQIGSITADGGNAMEGAWGDYDNNGFLDLLVVNGYANNVPNYLYRNNGNSNAWLLIKLVGTVSNRAGIGAKVRVIARIGGRTVEQMRESCRGSYLQDDLRVHFGLGNAAVAGLVRIEWPSGVVQELKDVPVRQILTVTEPPRLESLGQGRLRLLCWARQAYEIEASNDLDTWTSLGVVAIASNRPEVIDPGAATHPYRFYRAVQW